MLGAQLKKLPVASCLLEFWPSSCSLFSDTLTRMFHESPAATADMAVLPGLLGCRTLRRTVQVRLRSNTLRLPGGQTIFAVSPREFMKYPC